MPHIPDVGDADLAAEVDEHLVLDDVHAALDDLDLVGALVHRLLDRPDARLPRAQGTSTVYSVRTHVNTSTVTYTCTTRADEWLRAGYVYSIAYVRYERSSVRTYDVTK